MTITAGTILPYGGSSVPSGFLLCDGSAVSRTTYSTLFGVIGTTYGSGDGSTTFNVPDLRGRVPAGKDNMGGSAASRLTSTTMSPDGNTLGATGGAQTHTLTTAQMPSHTHVQSIGVVGGGAGSGFAASTNKLTPVATDISTQSAGTGGAHNNVQPALIVNYIIATVDQTSSNSALGTVGTVIDGGGSVITTGQKGYIRCPYAGTITSATLIADQSGDCEIDVWKAAYPTIPTVSDSIVASDPPTLSSAQTSQDTTLTGWTTSVSAGDVFGFNVNSASTITRVILELNITKS